MDDKNLNKCPMCDTLYDKKEKFCPKCLHKPPMGLKKALWILIFLILPFVFLKIYQDNDYKIINANKVHPHLQYQKTKKQSTSAVKIPLRQMEDLSYKTKNEIINKRKEYVKSSVIFSALENYTPNADVYKIEDKLAWISAYEIAKYGIKNSKDIAKGPSRHSISINNPEVLISLITPDLGENRNNEKFSEDDYFFPQALFWDKKENTITVHFNLKSFYENNPEFISSALYLDETNARDLGYNWIYGQQLNNINFLNVKNNFSIKPYKIKGYYHKGFSCQKEQGCNNYSPYQEPMVIRVNDLSASIDVKLWKNKPASSKQKPDITYKMVFE